MRGAFGAAAMWVLLGCSQPQDRAGTNTNWLKSCRDASECGGLACTCGRCTPECTNDGECADLGGRCSPAGSSWLQCAGTERPLCLAGCTSAAECAAGQLCQGGVCTDALLPTACTAHPDALVCEDFEGSVANYQPVVTAGNTVETTPGAAPSGSRALESVITSAPSTAYLLADIAAQSGGTLGVRAWIQVPAWQPTYDSAPIGLKAGLDPDWALRVVAKSERLEAWSYTTPLPGSAPLTAGDWHCIEMSVEVAEGTGRVQVHLDGTRVIDASPLDTLPTGGIDAVALGTLWSGGPGQILVDRVLVAPRPVDCWE